MLVERKEYLAELISWKDEQVIKVVTGIRRCGKSTLLAQYQDWLKTAGVSDAQIVSVNFEELEYEELLDYADSLGIEDYFWQQGGAAQDSFIPAFDLTGVPR